jgi:hypothetical protein
MKFRGAAQHHLDSLLRFANGGTYRHDIPTVIPTTKGRGKAFHLLPQGTLSDFCIMSSLVKTQNSQNPYQLFQI